jgi:hypothetical protein
MTSEDRIRVTHREREAVAEELRNAYAVGCLDGEELEERTSHAFAAKTRGELAAVTSDLPLLPAPGAAEGTTAAPPADGRAEPVVRSLGTACWLLLGAAGAWLIAVTAGGSAGVLLIFLWLTLLHVRGRLPRWFRRVAASLLISKVSAAGTEPVFVRGRSARQADGYRGTGGKASPGRVPG